MTSLSIDHLFSLEGHCALVTGGASGIGTMIAKGLVAAGAKVYITGRSAQSACETAAGIHPERCVGLKAELSTMAGLRDLVEQIVRREPQLHILVNNAGQQRIAPFDTFPETGWTETLDTNLKAPFFLCQGLLPLLSAAATRDNPSRIINIGSVGGLHTSLIENYAYAAAKAGLHHLTHVLSKWMAPRHITVNAIAPGAFPSKMTALSSDAHRGAVIKQTPLGRLGSTDDMAGAAIYLASRAGSYVTGSVLVVDGGMLAAL